jgi:hypothetical protein
MKALIRKELRENLKVALPGFLILSVLLSDSWADSPIQPLVNRNMLFPLTCNLFGLFLGWCQVFSEKNRNDLWAFLIHRPLTQTQIFMAKVIAGLAIYLAAMGLPMLVFIVACSRPGQYASPFEWQMAWSLGGWLLSAGVVWYFAGLMLGLRQARWYASRGLVFIAALFIYMLSGIEPAALPGLWQEWLMIVAGVAILGTATWGAFQNCGSDAGQPVWGRRAVVLTLTVGFTLIGLVSQGVFELALHGTLRSDSASFGITRDGVICRVIQKADGSSDIRDLSGSPLKDSGTGSEISLAGFDRLTATNYPLNVDFGDQSRVRALMSLEARFYAPCKTVDRVRWYWIRSGELAGYDTATRRLVGTIKPDESVAADARFLRPQVGGSDSSDSKEASSAILATPRHVWELNLQARTARVLFTAAEGDAIGGARNIGEMGFVVVTRNLIEMLAMDGSPIWKTTYKMSNSDALWVRVSRLADAQKFAVWVGPYWAGNRNNQVGQRTYSQVLFVSSDTGLVSQTTLPNAAGKRSFAGWSYWLSALLMPPVPVFYFLLGWKSGSLIFLLTKISFGAGVVCALGGWWLGRRYQFSRGTQIKWAIFHLLAGLPGFIAFLSVQEWPARETCPHCKKLRVVDRVQCEHCGESFAPAQKDGTEIFEGLTEKIPVEA